MINPLARVRDFFLRDLWTIDRSSIGRPRQILLDAARTGAVVFRDVYYGQMTLRAMGLVYTTLLSLVPFLAFTFSVLKAFGVQNALEPLLLDLVAPLGPDRVEVASRIVQFVNNMKVGVLGAVGLALLIYTVLSLIQQVEGAFNAIWRVRGMRSVMQRFSDYLSVVLVGPVLVVSAMALTASFMSTGLVRRITSIKPFGALVAYAGEAVPYVLICAAFTFVYLFIPNTKVRWGPALTGGIIGGVLWETVGWIFASFMVSSTRYTAIYSGFAIVILFMIWLYLSWLILLVGCDISFYRQHPQMLTIETWENFPNTRLIEQAAVSVMYLAASHFHDGRPAWNVNALTSRLGLDVGTIEDVVAALMKKGLLIETGDDPPGYVPGRDIDTILLRDVYSAVRSPGDEPGRRKMSVFEPAEGLVREVDDAIGSALSTRSLKDVVLRDGNRKERAAA